MQALAGIAEGAAAAVVMHPVKASPLQMSYWRHTHPKARYLCKATGIPTAVLLNLGASRPHKACINSIRTLLQVKAHQAAEHPALDWIYPVSTALAAFETAVLVDDGIAWGPELQTQVLILRSFLLR